MSIRNTAIGQSDLVIVGAGIVGLAHAVAAVRRGLSVTIVERDHRAVGASIRNFGHCCITAQHGELLELARASRELWLGLSVKAGFTALQSGALFLARSATELAVLEEMAGERGRDEVTLVTPRSAGKVLSYPGREPQAGLAGGAYLSDDLRVDPRTAASAIAAWLERQPGVTIHWATAVSELEPGVVRTSRGTLRAANTIVCVGHDLDYLLPELAAEGEVERCALQMMLVEPPAGLAVEPAVLTGTSMLRYEAFARTSAATALRAEVAERSPRLLSIGANVMFTQRPDGSILVGDTHRYDATLDPFQDESASALIRAEVASILGVESLRVLQRWQGVYASSPRQPILVATPIEGVTAVSVTSGIGMTVSMGLGERTIAALS